MGICAYYERITPAQLEAIRREPEREWEILGYEAEPARRKTQHLDIDKSWDEINRMLNGETYEGSGPLWNAVLGGAFLTEPNLDDEFWYEHSNDERFLTPAEVQETAQALATISESDLRERFQAMEAASAGSMAGMGIKYAPPRSDVDERYDYLSYHFGQLRAFFQQAAVESQAMRISIV